MKQKTPSVRHIITYQCGEVWIVKNPHDWVSVIKIKEGKVCRNVNGYCQVVLVKLVPVGGKLEGPQLSSFSQVIQCQLCVIVNKDAKVPVETRGAVEQEIPLIVHVLLEDNEYCYVAGKVWELAGFDVHIRDSFEVNGFTEKSDVRRIAV